MNNGISLDLILEIIIVVVGLLSVILGKKWRDVVKLTKKIPLVRKVFEEGVDVLKRLEEIEDLSKLKKDDLVDLLKETQEVVVAAKKAWEDP